MNWLLALLACFAIPSVAHADSWDDAKKQTTRIIEEVAAGRSVLALGHGDVINEGQANFLLKLKGCWPYPNSYKSEQSVMIVYDCPEEVSEGGLTSKKWGIDLGFDEGRLISFNIHHYIEKPRGWRPPNG